MHLSTANIMSASISITAYACADDLSSQLDDEEDSHRTIVESGIYSVNKNSEDEFEMILVAEANILTLLKQINSLVQILVEQSNECDGKTPTASPTQQSVAPSTRFDDL